MKKIISFLPILLLAFRTHADPELKGAPSDPSQSLSGAARTALIYGDADVEMRHSGVRAHLTLKVVTENKSLQTALRTKRELTSKIVGYLEKKGIRDDQIQIARFSSTPRYNLGEKPKSYRVENLLKVSIDDEDKFETVAGAIDSFPELRYIGVELDEVDIEFMKSQALDLAFNNALERKKKYEEKFGVRLVLRGFSELPIFEGTQQNDANLAASGGTQSSSSSLSSAVYNSSPQSPFGEVNYSARVKVEYTVEPK